MQVTPQAPSSASLLHGVDRVERLARRLAERVAAGVADGPEAEGEAVLGAVALHPGGLIQGGRHRGLSSVLPAKPGRAPGSAPATLGTGRSTRATGDDLRCVRTHAATASATSRHRPAGDAAQQRRAEGRALVHGRALQRQLQHRRDDPQPQLAARAAAAGERRRPRSTSAHAGRRQSRSPQATPSSTARTSAPRSWRSARPGERAARVGVGVRRALAGQVGQEGQALDAGRPRRGLGGQRVEVVAGRDDVAQPAQRARRRQHHAHRVPGAGHGVAERVHAGLRVGAVRVAARRTRRRRCPSDDRGRAPAAIDAGAERARGLVAGARGDGHAGGRACRDTSGDSSARRQPRRGRPPARAAPRRSSAAARRRAAACRRRRRRRSRARRSAAGGRSPWAAARARSGA